MSQKKSTRSIYGLFVAGVFALLIWKRYVPKIIIVGLGIWVGLLFNFIRKCDESRKPIHTLLALGFIVMTFFGIETYVRFHTQEVAWLKDPEAKLLDTIISPLPGNFFCWSVMTVETLGEPPVYKLQSGIFSNVPGILSPEDCMKFQVGKGEKENRIKKTPNDDPKLLWTNSFKAPLDKFATFYNENCLVRDFLKFSRAPFFRQRKGEAVFADFRFERAGLNNFSQVTVAINDQALECERKYPIPPWKPPRSDLIKTFP